MPLRSLRDVDKRVVAVVVTLAFSAVVAFTFAYGQLGLFRGGYEMSGVFKNSGGLKNKDEVRQAGVKIGTVTKVAPDFARGTVVITWRVQDGIRLGPQTRADITTANLLGGRYLRISGPVAKPYLDTRPAPERRIPLGRTSVPYTVVDALDNGTATIGALDVTSIDKILKEAQKITTPSKRNLNALLVNLASLAATLNEHSPELERLISNSKDVSAALAAKTDDLSKLIDAARTLLEVISTHRDELSTGLGSSGRVLGALGDTVAAKEKQLDSLLADLHTTAETLAPHTADLNTDLALLGPTFKGFARVGDTGHLGGFLSGLGFVQPPDPVLIPEARP